jgi:dipeptidyl aminopeptidase/acylaminoacyl peptidase
MTTNATMILRAAVAGAALSVAPGAIAQDAPTKWTPEVALEVKQVGNVRVSPDGGRVVFEVSEAVMDDETSEWRTQIWIGDAAGADARQLTRGDASCSGARWSPDGRWIAFLSSRETDKSNIWVISTRGGEAQRLTGVETGVSSLMWSPDATHIAFTSTDPEPEEKETADKRKDDARVIDADIRMSRLRIVPLEADADGERPVRTLTEDADFSVGSAFGGGMDWSPDGSTIAFVHTDTPKVNDWPTADISLVDVESGEITPFSTTGAAESGPVFSPDGAAIAFRVSDEPPSWAFTSRIFIAPAEGGRPRPLALTHDAQPNIVGWTPDGASLLVSEGWRTYAALYALPTDGGEAVRMSPEAAEFSGANLNHTRTHLGFTMQSFDAPPEGFVSSAGDFSPVRVSDAQDLPDIPIGDTYPITWTAPDGREVEGLLTLPTTGAPGPHPLLVVIHGGPAGVFTNSFISRRGAYPIAAFANEGYAVLRPNPRGSSNYGKEYRFANYDDWGGGDYRDIMSGVDHLISEGVADPDRMGVMGWSYGGYMTSWIITQTDRFRAASVGAGVTNLVSFTGTADIPGFLPDYLRGEYWDGAQNFTLRSAMFNVGGVTTPTLIQHGENDARVPVSQGYELYNALRRQGVPVEMVVYPRQPHGVTEPRLQIDAMQRNIDWFNRWVLGKESAETE